MDIKMVPCKKGTTECPHNLGHIIYWDHPDKEIIQPTLIKSNEFNY
jgi:hypothetical protein